MEACQAVLVAMIIIGGFRDGMQQDTDENTVTDDNEESHCSFEEYEDHEDNGVACRTHDDCRSIGQKCCGKFGKKTCVKYKKALQKQYHAPFLGLIPRECPQETIPEPFAIRNCSTDRDCWPRLCCPDGETSYCRIALPLWDQLPARRLFAPLRNMLAYMQCTPPPPPLYDLFPKPCRSTIDCFPNLCCQEKDRRVCRPPKRSLLVLLGTLGQQRRATTNGWFG